MGEAKKRRQAQQSGRASRLAELEKMFSERGIDFDAPGFYDHANFTRYEQADPQFLETYGEYVVHRHRTLGYDENVRAILDRLAPIIERRLKNHNWLGSCVAISATLSRILDKLGIWNTIMHGSLTLRLGGDARHFAIIDEVKAAGYDTGHQWLIVPPYQIVDLTLYYQRWREDDSRFQSAAPHSLRTRDADIVRVRADDVIAAESLIDGADAEIHARLPDQRRFNGIFPARSVRKDRLELRYIPSGLRAPLEPLEGINVEAKAGVPASVIWEEDVIPAFGL